MNTFLIVYTSEHSLYKDFCKKKKGSISISYEDLIDNQEKYFVFEDEKICKKVLECELFVKIYDSLKVLKSNERYHTILYYIDTLDYVILDSFTDTIQSYQKKIKIPNLELQIIVLDEIDKESEKCLNQLIKRKQINLINKDYIQQMF
jgi:hypothetical protein